MLPIWATSAIVNKASQTLSEDWSDRKRPSIYGNSLAGMPVHQFSVAIATTRHLSTLREFVHLPASLRLLLLPWESHAMHVNLSSGVKENTFTIKNFMFASYSLGFLIYKVGSRLYGFVGRIYYIKVWGEPNLAACWLFNKFTYLGNVLIIRENILLQESEDPHLRPGPASHTMKP